LDDVSHLIWAVLFTSTRSMLSSGRNEKETI
jgi:hypothetical protein